MDIGFLNKTQRKYINTEFRQEIRNAVVNGIENSNLDSNMICIGIEGELRDYILILNYASMPMGNEASVDQNLKDLLSLASSFKPIATRLGLEFKTLSTYERNSPSLKTQWR